MRLFTGIDLAEDVRANLARLLERLRPTARLRWSVAENLHITTKFIGEWPEARLEELIAALSAAPRTGPISIAVRELGWFPNARAPRVFWAGIQAGEGLYELARAIDRVASRLGVEEEKRPYSPHLTLARIPPGTSLAALHRAVEALATVNFGSFSADCFYLYRSELSPAGSRYTKLVRFPLAPSGSSEAVAYNRI
jgi:2'-5' RNA ligase